MTTIKGVRRYHLYKGEEFKTNNHSGIVTVYITKGKAAFAFCSPKDQFSRKKAQIALERLFDEHEYTVPVKNSGFDLKDILSAYETVPHKPQYLPKTLKGWTITK